MTDSNDLLTSILVTSPLIGKILANWHRLALPDGWLAAGAVAQTVWNHAFGLPHDHGINDIDIVYFDADDLSADAEQAHASRIRDIFADIAVWMDVKNQARVHLWYQGSFGYPIPPYRSITEAVATFPTTATTVAVRPQGNGLEICAPYGLTDLLAPLVRPNKRQITCTIYEKKAARWAALWPELTIKKWDE